MISIAIVDDEQQYIDKLTEHLEHYRKENSLSFIIDTFTSGTSFLQQYNHQYNIVFMDIRMPYLNGLECAAQLRKVDHSVILVFLTNHAQYAINGYEYHALDYILKPITYPSFYLKFIRILDHLPKDVSNFIMVNFKGRTFRLEKDNIIYIETQNHRLIYHTLQDSYTEYRSLAAVEKELDPKQFVRCNACYLVNLGHITQLEEYKVYLGATALQISQGKKKSFFKAYREFSRRYCHD